MWAWNLCLRAKSKNIREHKNNKSIESYESFSYEFLFCEGDSLLPVLLIFWVLTFIEIWLQPLQEAMCHIDIEIDIIIDWDLHLLKNRSLFSDRVGGSRAELTIIWSD